MVDPFTTPVQLASPPAAGLDSRSLGGARDSCRPPRVLRAAKSEVDGKSTGETAAAATVARGTLLLLLALSRGK